MIQFVILLALLVLMGGAMPQINDMVVASIDDADHIMKNMGERSNKPPEFAPNGPRTYWSNLMRQNGNTKDSGGFEMTGLRG